MMTETTITVTPHEASTGHNNATTPTVKSDPGQGSTSLGMLKINVQYFRTIPGIIKLVQVVLGIICMACASPAYLSGTHWFLFVAVISFIASLIWVFVYLLSIREALKLPINWILTELLNTSVITCLYLIAFIVQLSLWSAYSSSSYKTSNIVAGVFGIFNTIAYGAGAFFLFLEWKSSRVGN